MIDSIRLTQESIDSICLNFGFNAVFMGKTVFFQDLKSLNVLGYQVLQFRKRQIITDSDQLKSALIRATKLKKVLPDLDYFTDLVYKAKQLVYSKRIDLDRDLESVIHKPIEVSQISSLNTAWAYVMNGQGRSSQKVGYLKPIICLEKIRKVLVKTVDLLNDRYNN